MTKKPADISAGFFMLKFSAGDGGKKSDEDKNQGPAVLKFRQVDDRVAKADKAQGKIGDGYLQLFTCRGSSSKSE
jgi:hypothetical protein